MRRLSFLLLYALVLVSCESNVKDFVIKKPDDKISILGIAMADSTPLFFVTNNIGLENSLLFPPLKDVKVDLLLNNAIVGTLSLNDSNWYSLENYKLVPGSDYVLKASAPGYKDVTAEFSVPVLPEMTVSDTNLKLGYDPDCMGCGQSYYFEYEINFMNQPGIDEYYSVEIIKKGKFSDPADPMIKQFIENATPLTLYSNAPYIETSRTYGDDYYNRSANEEASGYAFYFSDRLLNEGQNLLKLKTEIYAYYGDSIPNIEYVLIFKKIDYNMFEYVQSKGRNYNAEDNPFVQPVSIYNNVENGLGLVTGCSKTEYSIEMHDILKKVNDNIILINNNYDY